MKRGSSYNKSTKLISTVSNTKVDPDNLDDDEFMKRNMKDLFKMCPQLNEAKIKAIKRRRKTLQQRKHVNFSKKTPPQSPYSKSTNTTTVPDIKVNPDDLDDDEFMRRDMKEIYLMCPQLNEDKITAIKRQRKNLHQRKYTQLRSKTKTKKIPDECPDDDKLVNMDLKEIQQKFAHLKSHQLEVIKNHRRSLKQSIYWRNWRSSHPKGVPKYVDNLVFNEKWSKLLEDTISEPFTICECKSTNTKCLYECTKNKNTSIINLCKCCNCTQLQ